MLSYKKGNSTCVNFLNSNNINISEKNDLKAASAFSQGLGYYNDGMRDIESCVMPYELMSVFSSEKCDFAIKDLANSNSIKSTFNLKNTTDGKLSIDKLISQSQILKGEGVYPNNGCVLNKDDSQKIIASLSKNLSYENDKKLYDLAKQRDLLIDECTELEKNIDDRIITLSNSKNKLANQVALCAKYVSDDVIYRNLILKLKIATDQINIDIKTAKFNADERGRIAKEKAENARKANLESSLLDTKCRPHRWCTQPGAEFSTFDCDNKKGIICKDGNKVGIRVLQQNGFCIDDPNNEWPNSDLKTISSCVQKVVKDVSHLAKKPCRPKADWCGYHSSEMETFDCGGYNGDNRKGLVCTDKINPNANGISIEQPDGTCVDDPKNTWPNSDLSTIANCTRKKVHRLDYLTKPPYREGWCTHYTTKLKSFECNDNVGLICTDNYNGKGVLVQSNDYNSSTKLDEIFGKWPKADLSKVESCIQRVLPNVAHLAKAPCLPSGWCPSGNLYGFECDDKRGLYCADNNSVLTEQPEGTCINNPKNDFKSLEKCRITKI